MYKFIFMQFTHFNYIQKKVGGSFLTDIYIVVMLQIVIIGN
jgi:hypothetical protein